MSAGDLSEESDSAHPQCNPLAVRYPSRIPAYHKSGVGDQQQLRGKSPFRSKLGGAFC
jgi:hypothetical protein